ncbi:Hypothetical protein Minf_1254 [Methylacidiphilum infernorum V4]|uniref:Uncharacterized protein n=1 Tax=Methylacidiphilum infernorum (isolate V4) TaxID=481448 RepID=B3DVF5_METI4|nr:Hypothetical protein Minf_1254 [Methylacidiphilum infernorum V4]
MWMEKGFVGYQKNVFTPILKKWHSLFLLKKFKNLRILLLLPFFNEKNKSHVS